LPARHFTCLRFVSSTILAIAALALAAPAAWSFPWSIDMYRGSSIQPLAVAPRVMPDSTMPTAGAEPPMSREYMTIHEKNPLQPTPENLAKGKELFMNNCSPCHGEDGKGNGPVAHLLKTKPKDLVGGISKDLPDGYIYGTIRDGGIAMPSLDDAMSAHERWDVVMFVRSMQQAAKAGVAAR
jgi:mono/diheme cytochrome c family protein